MEELADSENLTALVDSVRMFTSEMLNENFDKEDVKNYINNIIDKY